MVLSCLSALSRFFFQIFPVSSLFCLSWFVSFCLVRICLVMPCIDFFLLLFLSCLVLLCLVVWSLVLSFIFILSCHFLSAWFWFSTLRIIHSFPNVPAVFSVSSCMHTVFSQVGWFTLQSSLCTFSSLLHPTWTEKRTTQFQFNFTRSSILPSLSQRDTAAVDFGRETSTLSPFRSPDFAKTNTAPSAHSCHLLYIHHGILDVTSYSNSQRGVESRKLVWSQHFACLPGLASSTL